MKSLSIIVPLYNKNQIQHTLISINKKCNDLKLNYEIIVVENESTDKSLAKQKNGYLKITTIQNYTNHKRT